MAYARRIFTDPIKKNKAAAQDTTKVPQKSVVKRKPRVEYANDGKGNVVKTEIQEIAEKPKVINRVIPTSTGGVATKTKEEEPGLYTTETEKKKIEELQRQAILRQTDRNYGTGGDAMKIESGSKYPRPDLSKIDPRIRAKIGVDFQSGPNPGEYLNQYGVVLPYGYNTNRFGYDERTLDKLSKEAIDAQKTGKQYRVSPLMNATYWEEGDGLFIGPEFDDQGWRRKYDDKMLSKIKFTPDDEKEIADQIELNIRNNPETYKEGSKERAELERSTRMHHARYFRGGWPDFEQMRDYTGMAERPKPVKDIPPTKQPDMNQLMADVKARQEAELASRTSSPEYKQFQQKMAEANADKARKVMRRQGTPGRPNDNMRVRRYNDNFSGRPGSQNRAVGPRVVRRRLGN